ncbi:pilin, partial [Patescibacteria group bacterium]|nr:pilin [Patescibacteria group bacterium]
EDDLKGVVADVVNIVLGFLGIISVIIILFAGFKWMTAAGNEEQVSEAKKMLVQAVIGLGVVFLAWAIASFVITNLQTATSAP